MRYVLIVNPASGSRSHQDALKYVETYFKKHGLALSVRVTTHPGEATELARQAAQEAEVVIGAGGDGTINEVMEGLAGSRVALGILPWGTGNVFAAELGIPSHLRGQCQVLRRNRRMLMDVGRLKTGGLTRYFLLMFSAGFDAYALRRADKDRLKPFLGPIAYAAAAFRSVWRYHFPEITAEFPDGTSEKGAFVLISNTRLYGRIFSFAPSAVPTDGQLDVTILRDRTRWRTLGFLLKALWGAWTGRGPRIGRETFRDAVYLKTTSVKLSGPAGVLAQWDGDTRSGLPVDVDVVPAALPVIVPRKFQRL